MSMDPSHAAAGARDYEPEHAATPFNPNAYLMSIPDYVKVALLAYARASFA